MSLRKKKIQINVFSMLSYIKGKNNNKHMYGHTFLLYFLKKQSLEGQMED